MEPIIEAKETLFELKKGKSTGRYYFSGADSYTPLEELNTISFLVRHLRKEANTPELSEQLAELMKLAFEGTVISLDRNGELEIYSDF